MTTGCKGGGGSDIVARVLAPSTISGDWRLATPILAVSALFVMSGLGIGLLASTFAKTQQEAMLIVWLLLLPFRLVGIAVHIGSQILDLAPFRDAIVRAAEQLQQPGKLGGAQPGVALVEDDHPLVQQVVGGGLQALSRSEDFLFALLVRTVGNLRERHVLGTAHARVHLHHEPAPLEEAVAGEPRESIAQPRYAPVLNDLGLLLITEGRHGEAVPLLKRALERDPGFVNARINLGLALTRRAFLHVGAALEQS